MITDDETSFDLYIGNKKYNYKGYGVCSDGFINIMNPENFVNEIERYVNEIDSYSSSYKTPDEDIFPISDAFIIENFTGSIEIGSEKYSGGTTNDFDFNDYIQHQTDGSVFMKLPEGTKITEIDLSKPRQIKANFRNHKINTIINSEEGI